MENFTTPIVNSKQATKDLLNIKSQHADILLGMQNQQLKVQQYAQAKQDAATIEADKKSQMGMEQSKLQADQQKHSMTLQADAEKNRMANDQKNKELEIKKMALTSD
jgi:hypothetical protein